MPAYLSLKIHHVSRPLSNLRLYYLLHTSYLFDEVCAHRVRVDYRVVFWSPLLF